MTTPVAAASRSGTAPPPAASQGRSGASPPNPQSRSGTAPPPVRRVTNRPPVAPGMGPSRAGTPPPNTRAARQQRRPPARQPARPRPQQQRRRQRVTVGRQAPDTPYQNVILAEFVAAILLVAATPFAKKESSGVSPYEGKDLIQLVAITLTYFILALVSSTGRGQARFAAWFGGLILLTVGLGEAARLAKLLDVFGMQAKGEAPGTGGAESPQVTGINEAPATPPGM